jgi:hypothetical protein
MLRARLSPISTVDDWIDTIYIRDSDDGTAFVLTGCTAELGIRKIGEETITTVASTSGGEITFPATGYLHWEVLDADYEFDVGEYDVRLKLVRDGYTTSIIIGTLPVIDGLES